MLFYVVISLVNLLHCHYHFSLFQERETMDISKREKKSMKWKKQASTKSTVSTGNAINQTAVRPRSKLFAQFNFRAGRLNTKLFTAVHEGEVRYLNT